MALLLLALLQASSEPSWNQFRGPLRDGRSPDRGLLPRWPEGGPALLWKATAIGAGYSSVSIHGQRIFTMGDRDRAAQLFALDAADGRLLWKTPVGKAGGGGGYPGPRCTPATDGARVWALGQFGDLVCVDAADGTVRWKTTLEGAVMSDWGYSESPLLDGELLFCTPGGPQGTVAAYDKTSGTLRWRSTGLTDPAAYSSLIAADLGGRRHIVVLTGRSLAGLDRATGRLLWKADRKGETAVCTTPLHHDGLFFVSSAYNVGCAAFRVRSDGGGFAVQELYQGRQMRNHHGGLVAVDGRAYGFDEDKLKCLDLGSGKVLWADRSVGKGSVAWADGLLVVRHEDDAGAVALVEASPEGYRERSRFEPPDRGVTNSWANPVIFGGRLYLRDENVLLCYAVKAP
jgi:outer membrane protein assembly factor BamB